MPTNFRNCAARWRHRWVIAGFALAIVGCRTPTHNQQSQAQADMWIAALNAHRVDQLIGLLDANGTYEEPLTPRPLSGVALAEFFSQHWRTWPDLTFTLKAAAAEDDRLVLEWRSHGTHVFGRTLTIDGVTVIEWANNRIHRAHVYYDPRVYMQLFAPPPPK